ncbi:MAG: NAD(P)H-dependent oxidoreductase [Bacteroidales bacterium]
MNLAIINGSPRGQKSNSTILTDQFLAGYRSKRNVGNISVSLLIQQDRIAEHLQAYSAADTAIIIFPLYTDSMPGIVKSFFEQISELHTQPAKLGFIVQSGFPEAIHSVAVEKYLKKLTHRLQCQYLGTVIKGGVEGIQMMPAGMNRKLFAQFNSLGACFAQDGTFNPTLVQKMRKPYKMSVIQRAFFRIMLLTGLPNFYWNTNLKKNGAWQKRFDQPYL